MLWISPKNRWEVAIDPRQWTIGANAYAGTFNLFLLCLRVGYNGSRSWRSTDAPMVDLWLAKALIVDYWTGRPMRYARKGNTLHVSADHDPSDGPCLDGFQRVEL